MNIQALHPLPEGRGTRAQNRMDSHRAAGVTRPVEVTLPADMNPSLVIQDFGLGLSREELVTVYSTYGSSTKRDSDEAIGGFGIGSKAAFSMTEQFVVTGVKDGEKTVMLFSIGKAGMGEAVTVSHSFGSTDPNGVIVSIPIRDVAAMERTAATFFTTWQPGVVLVDGDQAASIFDDAFAVGDRFHLAADKSCGLTVVMGGVGYPVDAALLRLAIDGQSESVKHVVKQLGSARLLVTATVGDADITPSREALRDTDRTVMFVREALVAFDAAVRVRVIDHVASAPTHFEAATRLFSAGGAVNFLTYSERGEITWRGCPLRNSVVVPTWTCARLTSITTSAGSPTGRSAVRTQESLDLQWTDRDKLLVVTGVTTDKQWGAIKRKFKAYQTVPSHAGHTIVMATSQDTGSSAWLSWGESDGSRIANTHAETISFETYAARVKNAVIAPSAERGQFRYAAVESLSETKIISSDDQLTLSELREATELIWIHENDQYCDAINAQVAAAHPDATWIVLRAAQTKKALRKRLPEAISLHSLALIRAEEVVAAVTPQVQAELTEHYRVHALSDNGFAYSVTKYVVPLLPQIRNARFIELVRDLATSQGSKALSPEALLVREALRLTGRTVASAFGLSTMIGVDLHLKAEFMMAFCATRDMSRCYDAKLIAEIGAGLVVYVNALAVVSI